ncbi:helix-turn-helix domain-containing protein [Limimaricola hongkongensis]|uniref:helix-turn-helix domain-containing protein n=1 Tax=Limimaricola hongkongensis TaxID=278132 RepID=UPI0013A5A356|nr:helix-turn-helix domain-containing protein [Limimaricola hongkongensis]
MEELVVAELKIPELETLIEEVRGLRADIRELLQRSLPPESLWDVKTMARYHRVSEDTVMRWVREGRIKSSRSGSKLRFEPRAKPD